MSGTVVADSNLSGTGASVVVGPSTADIPAGQLIAAVASCASVSRTFTCSDSAGVGNAYSLLQLSNATVGQSACLAVAVAAALTPTGTSWTFPISTGTPGGRMGAVAKFDDTLRSPFAIDISAADIGSPGANSFSESHAPVTSPELVLWLITMVSSLGAGLDSIALDGTLTQLANHNHINSGTRYYAFGYKKVLTSNPIADSATFQPTASDVANMGMVTVKLPVPPNPSGPTPGEKLILKLTG